MTCDEIINSINQIYDIIRIISDRNGALSLLIKHKKLQQYMVLRRFSPPVLVYDFLKNVDFPNLPTVFETYEAEDGQIVLEEYIDGLSVAEVLESGLYTYKGAKKVLYDVCDALRVLHGNGFIHRDIKPENIMISKTAQVKLIDFNASRRVNRTAQNDTVQFGTVGYASPEQLGLSQTDMRTDIYALGVLLNVMLTGEHPSRKLVRGHASKIVLKSTLIDPKSRFSTVKDFKSAL